MKKEKHNYASIKTLWFLMRGNRVRYAWAILALFVATLFSFLIPLVVRAAIDFCMGQVTGSLPKESFFPQGGFSQWAEGWIGKRAPWVFSFEGGLLVAALAVVVLSLISAVFMFLKGKYSAEAAERIAKNLRETLYDHLQHLPLSFHDRARTGDLVQRCSSDVETVRIFLQNQVVQIVHGVMMVMVALPILWIVDRRLVGLCFFLIPLIVFFTVLFFSRIKAVFKKMDEAEGALTTVIQENLMGVRVVRAFARQRYELKKFAEYNVDYRKKNYRLIRLLAVYWSLSDALSLLQVGIVLFVGAWWVVLGTLTIGTLYAALRYVNLFVWPIRQMGRVLADLGKTLVALGRIDEVLQQKREGQEREAFSEERGKVELRKIRGAIECQNLSFSYEERVPVLDGVTVSVNPGETLAIVGPTGAGKSTFINILLRLYENYGGSFKIDGHEVSSLAYKTLRSQISVVTQEPFLYSRTLRSNIAFSHPGASHEAIEEAAKQAAIHQNILEFEEGYETVVGERGVTLSGGQQQRMAIARALLRNAPILILDDSLSAVDTETEQLILAALQRRRGHQTTIIIAHRLGTVKDADLIMVMDKGKVQQLGTHANLVKEQGIYRELWKIQVENAQATWNRQAS